MSRHRGHWRVAVESQIDGTVTATAVGVFGAIAAVDRVVLDDPFSRNEASRRLGALSGIPRCVAESDIEAAWIRQIAQRAVAS